MSTVRIALIDNYDSYTYNLQQLLWQVSGSRPEVIYNDETTADRLLAADFTHFVISPGPGTPEVPADFGLCGDLIRRVAVPCLGVCLGHQGIAFAFGGHVVPAPSIMHGRRSRIWHTGTGLFEGIPQGFLAVRYHSLVAARPLPDDLIETAWSEDAVVMALRHRERPIHGVQFHPESVETAHGARLLQNFLDIPRPARPTIVATPALPTSPRPRQTVRWRRLDCHPGPEDVFLKLYADEPYSFWLDSPGQLHGMGRYSFMGSAGVGRNRIVRGYAAAGVVEVVSGTGTSRQAGSILDYLRRTERVTSDCPVPFTGGFVGYLGYGTKASLGLGRGGNGKQPDAELMWADRVIAFDHAAGCVYLVALGLSDTEAVAWFDETDAVLRAVPSRSGVLLSDKPPPCDVWSTVDRATYDKHFAEIQRWLTAGDSYEACYTYQLSARSQADPLRVYLRLRAENPAPYAAYVRFGDRRVLSSSPERFLKVDVNGWAESKPIKGTAPRHRAASMDSWLRTTLAEGEKTRSESLMIVDLIRNDLGRVCLPGTVRVSKLMAVESYATVHHLVSTIRGRLRAGVTGVDAVGALFPGGSMTGAPKKRTVELLDALEPADRGVYSGCLGYFSSNGAVDLSIIIRTIVWENDHATIGVGGAITAMSNADDEYAETRLKALTLLRALGASGAAQPTAVSADFERLISGA